MNSVFVQPLPDPQWTAATGSFKALIAANDEPVPQEPVAGGPVEVEIDAAFFASMLGAEGAPKVSQPLPVPEPAAANAPVAPAAGATGKTRHARSAGTRARGPRPGNPGPQDTRTRVRPRGCRWRRSHPEGGVLRGGPRRAGTRGRGRSDADRGAAAPRSHACGSTAGHWAQLFGLLLLAAQVVNHYRDELAASARFNRPLTALYGRLGVKLFPNWDLHAYDVRQLGASAEPTGPALITVRASIKNGAGQPQPLPLLRVTLQDRFGNRIAMRDVAPKSYLPPSIPASSFLAAGQRIDAELDFADPGAEAVGFEIDACLPARGGVSCANDAALR